MAVRTYTGALKPGLVFNRLTLISRIGVDKQCHVIWACKCSCGNYCNARADKLRDGRKQSCGCYLVEFVKSLHDDAAVREEQVKKVKEIAKIKRDELAEQRRLQREENSRVAKIEAKRRRELGLLGDGGITKNGRSRLKFATRHSHYLARSLKKENVDSSDPIWSVRFYTELIRDLVCFYCLKEIGGYGHGLDRIDNTKGHEASNVIPCCGVCNRFRCSIWTHAEMVSIRPQLSKLRQVNDEAMTALNQLRK